MAKVIAHQGDRSLKLTTEFRGWPLNTVKWYKENQELTNNEKFHMLINDSIVELTLSRINKQDAGTYTVVASSPCGEALLCAELCVEDDGRRSNGETFVLPPILMHSLTDQVIRVGKKAKLTVAASHPEVQIQWYKGKDKLHDNERYQVAHEGGVSTLDINMVEPGDEGIWRCEVIAAFGYVISLAKVQTIVPKGYRKPEFLEPLKALLTEQGTVSLECKVVGIPTPLLRWYKDGNEIKAGDMFNLRLQGTDENSLGTYTCLAINCMGRAVSSAQVTVTEKTDEKYKTKIKVDEPIPYFYEPLENKTIRVGENLRFTVRVRTPPSVQIAWFKNNEIIEASDKFHLTQVDDGIFHLDITPIEYDDQGQWRCTATNQYGQNSLVCKVEPNIPKHYRSPEFVEDLVAIFTDDGLVSFECKVIGVPTPILRWYKDGSELKPGDVHLLSGSNSLGNYSCVAKNCMGFASSYAELTLEDIYGAKEKRKPHTKQPPRFIQPLKDEMIILGTPFRFTVVVTCPPVPEVTWYKDNQRVDNIGRYKIRRERTGVYHLEIDAAEVGDQGLWKCLIVNDYGHSLTQCCFRVTVPRHFKKPVFIENLRAVLSEEGAVSLECKVVGVPQPLLKWYKDGVELKAGDIYKIVSGEGGTSCLGTYTCEASNCMGMASSTAALLAFDDKCLGDRYKDAFQQELSTIEEEFSTYGTPSITDNWDEYKTDMEFSIYDTPDITENEAKQIIEMFANEASEYVSLREAPELPPLRFIKETAMVGNILMEALIIDVPLDHFSRAEEMASQMNQIDNLATEADIAEISTYDPVIVDLPYDYSDAASLHELKISISDNAAVKDASSALQEAVMVEVQKPITGTATESLQTKPMQEAAFIEEAIYPLQPISVTNVQHVEQDTANLSKGVKPEHLKTLEIIDGSGLEKPEVGAALQVQHVEDKQVQQCQQISEEKMVKSPPLDGPAIGEMREFFSDDFTNPSENLGTEADVDSIASMEEFAADYVNGYADDEQDIQDLEMDARDIIDQNVAADESGRFTPTYASALDDFNQGGVMLNVNEMDYLASTTPVPQEPLLLDDDKLLDLAYQENGLSNLLLAEGEGKASTSRTSPGLLAELAGSVLQKAAEGIMTGAVLAESLVAMAANLVLPPEEQAGPSSANIEAETQSCEMHIDPFVATFVTKTEAETVPLLEKQSTEELIFNETQQIHMNVAQEDETNKLADNTETEFQSSMDKEITEENEKELLKSPTNLKEIEELGLCMAKDAITTALLNLKNEICTQENIIKSLQDEPISASSDLSSLTDELEQLKGGKKKGKTVSPQSDDTNVAETEDQPCQKVDTNVPEIDEPSYKTADANVPGLDVPSYQTLEQMAENLVGEIFESVLSTAADQIRSQVVNKQEDTPSDQPTADLQATKDEECGNGTEKIINDESLIIQQFTAESKTAEPQEYKTSNFKEAEKSDTGTSKEVPQVLELDVEKEETLGDEVNDQENNLPSPAIDSMIENLVFSTIEAVIFQQMKEIHQETASGTEQEQEKTDLKQQMEETDVDENTLRSSENLQKSNEEINLLIKPQDDLQNESILQDDPLTVDSTIQNISESKEHIQQIDSQLQTENYVEHKEIIDSKFEEESCESLKLKEDEILQLETEAKEKLRVAVNRLAEELVAKCILDAFGSLEEVMALLQKVDQEFDPEVTNKNNQPVTKDHLKVVAQIEIDEQMRESFSARLANKDDDSLNGSQNQFDSFDISKENSPSFNDTVGSLEGCIDTALAANENAQAADENDLPIDIPRSEGGKETKLRRSSRKEKRRRGSKKSDEGDRPMRQDSRDSSVGDVTSDDGDSLSSCSDAIVPTSAITSKKYTRTTSGTDLGKIHETDEFGLELDRRRSLPNIKEVNSPDVAIMTDFEQEENGVQTTATLESDLLTSTDLTDSSDVNKKNVDNSLTCDLEPPSTPTQDSDTLTDDAISELSGHQNKTIIETSLENKSPLPLDNFESQQIHLDDKNSSVEVPLISNEKLEAAVTSQQQIDEQNTISSDFDIKTNSHGIADNTHDEVIYETTPFNEKGTESGIAKEILCEQNLMEFAVTCDAPHIISESVAEDEKLTETKYVENVQSEIEKGNKMESRDDEKPEFAENYKQISEAKVVDVTQQSKDETKLKIEETSDIMTVKKEEPQTEEKINIKNEDKIESKPEDRTELTSEEEVDHKTEARKELIVEEKTELIPEEKTEPISEEKIEQKPEEKVELMPEEKTELKSEEKVELMPEEKIELKSEEKVELIPEEKTELKSEEKVKLMPEEKTELKNEEKIELMPEEKLELIPEEKTEPISKEKMEQKPEEKELISEEKMELKSEEKVELMPEEKAELKSEEKIELMPEEKPTLKPEEKTKLIFKEKMEQKPEEKEELISEEKMELKSEEKVELISEEKTELKSEEKIELMPEEKPELIPEEKTEPIFKEKMEQKPEKKELISEEKTELKSEEKIELLPEEKSELIPEEKTELISKEKMEQKPEEKEKLISEEKMELKSEEKVELMPEEKAELMPEQKTELKNEEKIELMAEEKPTLKPEEKTELIPEEKTEPIPEEKTEQKPEEKELISEEKTELKSKEKVELIHKEKAELMPKEKAELKSEEKVELMPEEKTELKSEEKIELIPEKKIEVILKEKTEPKSKEKIEQRPEEKELIVKEKTELIPDEKMAPISKENTELNPLEKIELKPETDKITEDKMNFKAELENNSKQQTHLQVDSEEIKPEELKLKGEENVKLLNKENAELITEERTELIVKDKKKANTEKAELITENHVEPQTGEVTSITEEKVELKIDDKNKIKPDKKMELTTEEKAELITEEKTELQFDDNIKSKTEEKVERKENVNAKSATEKQTELQTGAQAGLKPEKKIEINADEREKLVTEEKAEVKFEDKKDSITEAIVDIINEEKIELKTDDKEEQKVENKERKVEFTMEENVEVKTETKEKLELKVNKKTDSKSETTFDNKSEDKAVQESKDKNDVKADDKSESRCEDVTKSEETADLKSEEKQEVKLEDQIKSIIESNTESKIEEEKPEAESKISNNDNNEVEKIAKSISDESQTELNLSHIDESTSKKQVKEDVKEKQMKPTFETVNECLDVFENASDLTVETSKAENVTEVEVKSELMTRVDIAKSPLVEINLEEMMQKAETRELTGCENNSESITEIDQKRDAVETAMEVIEQDAKLEKYKVENAVVPLVAEASQKSQQHQVIEAVTKETNVEKQEKTPADKSINTQENALELADMAVAINQEKKATAISPLPQQQSDSSKQTENEEKQKEVTTKVTEENEEISENNTAEKTTVEKSDEKISDELKGIKNEEKQTDFVTTQIDDQSKQKQTVEQKSEDVNVKATTDENITLNDKTKLNNFDKTSDTTVGETEPKSVESKQWVDAVTKEKQKTEEEKQITQVESEQKIKIDDNKTKSGDTEADKQLEPNNLQAPDDIKENEEKKQKSESELLENGKQSKETKKRKKQLKESEAKNEAVEDPKGKSEAVEELNEAKNDAVEEQKEAKSEAVEEPKEDKSKAVEEPKEVKNEAVEEPKDTTNKCPETKQKKVIKKKKTKVKESKSEVKENDNKEEETKNEVQVDEQKSSVPVENSQNIVENDTSSTTEVRNEKEISSENEEKKYQISEEILSNDEVHKLVSEESTGEEQTKNKMESERNKLEEKLFGRVSIEEVASTAMESTQVNGTVTEPPTEKIKELNNNGVRPKNIINIEELLSDETPLETFVQNVRTFSRLRTINEVHEICDDVEDEHIVISALTPSWVENDTSSSPQPSHSASPSHSISRHRIQRADNADPKSKYAPQFIMQLKDFTIPENYRMRLTCCTIGTPEPKIRWLKNGQPIDSTLGYRQICDLGICVLEIPRSNTEDSGEYTCIASNEYGEVSTAGTLTVKKRCRPIEIDSTPTRPVIDAKGKCGDSITMDCSVTGWPAPSVTWMKDEAVVQPNERIETSDFPSGAHRLVINSASTEDSGIYKCVATNHLGKDEVVTSIKVTGRRKSQESEAFASKKPTRPSFITKPHNRVVREGETVKFSCSVVGHPQPKAQWVKDGSSVNRSSRVETVDKDDVHSITITDVTASDAGLYTVTATNSMGKIFAVAKLDVMANSRATISTIRECKAYSFDSYSSRRPANLSRCYQITGFNVPQVLYPSSSSSDTRRFKYTGKYK